MRMCAFIMLLVISVVSIVMPVQCDTCLSSGDKVPCIITLDVCSKGGSAIVASFDIPFVIQDNFILTRFEPNTNGPDHHKPVISEAYLQDLEKPPRA